MLHQLKEGMYYGEKRKAVENECFKLSITNYAAKAATDRHYHENDYLSILLNGHYYEDHKNTSQMIEPGSILFRPKDYIHQNKFENEGGTCFNIEFKTDWQLHLAIDFNLPKKFISYRTEEHNSLFKLILNFKTNYCEDLAKELMLDWLLSQHDNKVLTTRLPWAEKVKAILENETNSNHSLKSLSERVFVHPVYLSRGFKEKYGHTIGEYQLKMKLVNCLQLLLNTNWTIAEIAFKNAFHDDAHFIRAFNATYNISPLQFRKKIKS
jgi:AraC family transcriptional regulator